jgi:biotin transport system substrate-specific component
MQVKERAKNSIIINTLTKIKSNQLIWIFSFTLMTAIAAQISIPVKPVPFTLQTMMVVLAGAFLGARNGAYSQMLYLLLGVIGLPVFAAAAEPYGIARLFGPTGGYLLAFPLAAYVTGKLVQKYKSYFGVAASMFAGNIIVIVSGSVYLYAFFVRDFSTAVTAGAVLFSLWTVIKVIASAAVYYGIRKQ